MFLPIEGIPDLQVFDKEARLDDQLRQAAQTICRKDIKVCDEHYLVRIPKYVVWHRKDFGGNQLSNILEFMCKNNMMSEETEDYAKGLIKVLKESKKPLHMVDPVKISWKINMNMLKSIKPKQS